MAVKVVGSPFGSGTRTRVLVVLRLLGSSFQRELARLLGCAPSVVQKAPTGLERDGLVSGRLVGRTRSYTLNPSYFARKELGAFLCTACWSTSPPEYRHRGLASSSLGTPARSLARRFLDCSTDLEPVTRAVASECDNCLVPHGCDLDSPVSGLSRRTA